MRLITVGGGQIEQQDGWVLSIPPREGGYANAQIDDFNLVGMAKFQHRPKTHLSLKAKFAQSAESMVGTAGFGFWNAPIGDPSAKGLRLPSAAWFFYAAQPNRLPFLGGQTGWFAATILVKRVTALKLLPLVIPVTIGNWIRPIYTRIWPMIEKQLGISYVRINAKPEQWHTYQIALEEDACLFSIDDQQILKAPFAASKPMCFVAWIDNQYMIATAKGRFGAGTLPVTQSQALQITDLAITNG